MESKPAAESRPWPGVQLQVEASDGGLKKLVLRWFTETQASLILNQGNFPDWFQGFAGRKEAEDLLQDKPVGCFLVRLTDKTVGYILSYRGLDRYRHFVITQNTAGQFVIAGDRQTFHSLTELIQYYQVNFIQPFGEHLTCSYHQESAGELYDVVTVRSKQRSGVSVQAVKGLWDQNNLLHSANNRNQRPHKQQQQPAPLQPPSLPPKSKSRKLTGTVSADASSLCQAVPPLPKRGGPLSFSLSGFVQDTSSRPSQVHYRSIRPETPRGDAQTIDSPPVESRCRSLPLEASSIEDGEEEECTDPLSLSFTALGSNPTLDQRRVTCFTYSLHEPFGQRSDYFRSERGDLATLKLNPLYQTAAPPGEGSVEHREVLYAEVQQRPPPAGLPDDTYEQLPQLAASSFASSSSAAAHSNTYESLEDMKKSKSSWGKKNKKWKKFLPEPKK